ncbi:MAG TPA: MazG nucleotide pyrophosphohydrolase domain-containing protein [Draconibacterium sp.]|jgi:NTP pyrophosphatase (non-canonical NTP hydrolase)|nr:MazG nucleotide pyrophosphohydrolase domain-containing protein [Draconibacterium sp.]
MPELTENPNLKDFQKYVEELENERGFSHQTIIDKCLLLGEEVGELFKAVRKSEGLAVDTNSNFTEIGDELTDILIYLCAVANRKGIDLEKAFREKEEKNKNRTWKPSQPINQKDSTYHRLNTERS